MSEQAVMPGLVEKHERRLKLTVYDARRRIGRLGWWADWTLEAVTVHGDSVEIREQLAHRVLKRNKGGIFVELDLGPETDLSRKVHALMSKPSIRNPA